MKTGREGNDARQELVGPRSNRGKQLHQIFKIVSISPKRLTYAFLSFSLVFDSFFC